MSDALPPKLGRYEVLEEIGKGAMGVVYLARDPLIGRLVALKTFRVGFSAKDEELVQFRSRFVREAQSAGILSHPNIVTIHDVVDEGAQGICFIAMEYVKGTNLKQLLQRPEPFSHQFVVEVVSQIAEALDYAHSRGVVHRDIKPANILITVDNKVKITDFGIARLDTSNLTMEGQLLGTPNYMAPEQIQGKDVDHRADIFSLGVVFYETVARRKPFQGENLTQVTHKIVYEPFTPPEEIVKDLPSGLSAVLTRCLQKDPNRRYPRAAEVARELRSVLEQQANMDDTIGTQEVQPVGTAPELQPTRRLDRAELAAAVAATSVPARPSAAASPPPGAMPDPELGPTRRLDRSELQAAVASVAASAAPAAPVAPPPAPKPAPAAVAPSPAPVGSGTATVVAPRPTAPAPPPPPVAPAAPSAPRPTPGAAATPTATRAAPAAASQSAQSAQPARAPRGSRKGLWWGLGTGAAVLVAGIVAFAALSGREPAPPPAAAPPVAPGPSPEQQNRITAATALTEARTRFAQGDLDGALQSIARAELAEPQNLEVKLLREAIEIRKLEVAAGEERGRQVSDGLVAARDATVRKSWDEAVTAARGVLAVEPTHEEARRLLADAQRNQRRDRERAETARVAAQTPTAPTSTSEPVAPVANDPTPPPAKDAVLKLRFLSDQSEGVLTVYAGERQVLREPFRFVRKSGMFTRERVSGMIEAQRRVPAGPMTLRVYVALPGKPTKAVVVEGEIVGGTTPTLEMRIDAEGRATAELR